MTSATNNVNNNVFMIHYLPYFHASALILGCSPSSFQHCRCTSQPDLQPLVIIILYVFIWDLFQNTHSPERTCHSYSELVVNRLHFHP